MVGTRILGLRQNAAGEPVKAGRVATNNVVSVGDTWQFDANPSGASRATFTIDAMGGRFADVTFRNGRKSQVEIKTLRRGLRHAKKVET